MTPEREKEIRDKYSLEGLGIAVTISDEQLAINELLAEIERLRNKCDEYEKDLKTILRRCRDITLIDWKFEMKKCDDIFNANTP